MQSALQLLRPRIASLLAFTLVFICLLPVLHSGLYSDDLPNFQKVNAVAKITWPQVFEEASHNVEHWKGDGRYTPLSLYLQDIVFRLCSTITAYKVYILCVDLLAVLAFAFMMWCLGAKELIGLFMLFYLGEIQFRIQLHDAFTSLHGMYPLLCVFSFACIGFYGLYLSKHKWHYYAISLVLSAIPILISESGIFVLPALFVCGLYLAPDFKKAFKQIIPFAAIYGAYIIYIAYLRYSVNIRYSGLETDFSLGKVLNVIEIQVFSATPFSNLYNQVAIPQIFLFQMNNAFCIISVVVLLIVGAFVSFLYFKSKTENSLYKPANLIAVALILLLLPAFTLAPSVKYQNELWLGAGYLPVYIQNFGFALLLAVLAWILIGYRKSWARILLTILFAANIVGGASAYLFNNALIKVRNYDSSEPGEDLVKSVKNGILTSCPNYSRITVANNYHLGDENNYAKIFDNGTGKTFLVFVPGESQLDTVERKDYCYLLECAPGDTIYTKLYSLNCNDDSKIMLIKCDTTLHSTRVTLLEESIMNRK